MDKLRLLFSKTGRAVYISHLDLMHTFQRAFSRAGYTLKHSEGFNPHPIISIAMPLSVGTSSVCELMDFRLTRDEDITQMASRLTAALPEGIEVLEVYEAERKITDLKWLEAEGTLSYDVVPEFEALRRFYARPEIVITKKTKRGVGQMNLADGIRSLEIALSPENSGDLLMHVVVSAQEPPLNPDLLVEALRQLSPELSPDFAAFRRLEVYDTKMKRFR